MQPPREKYVAPPPRPLPMDNPSIPPNTPIILYVHGGGSRLEEAVSLAQSLIATGATVGQNYTVLSLDMPNSGYGDSFDPMAIDPLTATGSSYDAANLPILNFDENYLIGFIETLDKQFGNIKNRIVAVMGGSLGGNLSLISASLAGPAHPYFNTMVAWSPTAMIKTTALSRALVASGSGALTMTNWGPEQPSTRREYMTHLYFAPLSEFLGMPNDPELWYRDGFSGVGLAANGPAVPINCKSFRIAQSRFDRYEIYSAQIRRWTTALDTEQAILDYRMPDPASGNPLPRYLTMHSRLLLAVGREDCISCKPNAPLWGAFVAASAGATAGSIAGSIAGTILLGPFGTPLGSAVGFVAGGIYGGGVQSLMNVDIQGYTHDVAALMTNTPGRTLFIEATGHSIHDERPNFFAGEIVDFLTHPDTNIDITLGTGGDDVRWNSQVWAGLTNFANQTVNWKLNEWWHPWNANPPAADNPCGLCEQLDYFQLPIGSTFKYTLGLSRTPIRADQVKTLGIQFVSGHSGPFDTGDSWDLAFVNLFAISGPAGIGPMLTRVGQPLLLRMGSPQSLWVTPVGTPNHPL